MRETPRRENWMHVGCAGDSQEREMCQERDMCWSVVQRIGLTSEALMLTNWANNVAAFATGTFASRHVAHGLSVAA